MCIRDRSNDGVIIWMEDEDYFKFSDDILINGTEKLYFQDTGTHILVMMMVIWILFLMELMWMPSNLPVQVGLHLMQQGI